MGTVLLLPNRDQSWLGSRRFRPPASVLAGIVIAIATFAPLLSRGVVLLIDFGDYPVGPHPRMARSAWGFPPGLTSRAPVEDALVALFRLSSSGTLRLLPLLLVGPLAGFGFARLFRSRPAAAVPATVLFCVNPFVYERLLAGQVYFVVGYALLPGFLALLVPAAGDRQWRRGLELGCLFALLIALAPHYLFVAGLVLAGIAIGAVVRRDRASIAIVAAASAAAFALSLYWIVPGGTGASALRSLSSGDLRAFSTAGDPRVHLMGNVAGLYGFWRQNGLAKYGFAPWPVVAVLILAVVGFGTRITVRHARERTAFVALGGAAVVAFFLALGAQGPTGAGFRWLFDHVAAFRIMREPQKFVAVLALAYAVFYGVGTETLLARARSLASRRALAVALVALPCLYTYTMFWGLHDNVKPTRFPSSWAETDRLMGTGSAKVIAFPWHLYVTFPWNHDRSTPNPATSYFRRSVIVSPDIEQSGAASQAVDARSRYIGFLVTQGEHLHHFGNLVAPLDVKYILLSKVNDSDRYHWLYTQRDLRLVHQWRDLALFENTLATAPVVVPTRTVTVADWGQVVGLSDRARLTDLAVHVRHARPGPLSTPRVPADIPAAAPVRVTGSAVRYRITNRPPSRSVVLTEPYDRQWSLGGTHAVTNLGVTNLFVTPAPTRSSVIAYERWNLVRVGYLVSGAFALLIGLALLVSSRTRVSHGITARSADRIATTVNRSAPP